MSEKENTEETRLFELFNPLGEKLIITDVKIKDGKMIIYHEGFGPDSIYDAGYFKPKEEHQ